VATISGTRNYWIATPEVLFQVNLSRARIPLLEAEKIRHGGSPETVDALVVVSHDREMMTLTR